MSLPKEPRQLMINLMYLVLTAILALNVSAEIINAFFALEKGIKQSSAIVDNSNLGAVKAIEKAANSFPENRPYLEKAKQAQIISKEFNEYVVQLHDLIFKEAGGPNPEHPDRPANYKDKDVTTRILCVEGKGTELQKKIEEIRGKFLALIDGADKQAFEESLALQVDKIDPQSDKKTWAEYKFFQMPVAAVMPMFAKLQNDAKTSETAILSYFLNKTGGDQVRVDKFLPILTANKSYLLVGDEYKAEVGVGAYSSTQASNFSISVNGSNLPLKDGLASYTARASSPGSQKLKVTATVKNPVTGRSETVSKDFEYEVGEGSVTVSAEKMNVFYMGVENPIAVSAAGASSAGVQVSGTNCNLTPNGKGSYMVRPVALGEAKINVSSKELKAYSKTFRVKRIPDPVACFRPGGEVSGGMGTGEMKAQGGIIADLRNFDFEAKCQIVSFSMTHVPKREDPVTVTVTNGVFNDAANKLKAAAKTGSIYYFDEVKTKCPGDVSSRKIPGMVWNIK